MVVGYVIAAASPFVYVWQVYKRSYFPWLVRKDERAVDFSICLDRESLSSACDRIEEFIRKGGVGDETVSRVTSTVEENGLAALKANGLRPPCVEYFVSLEESGGVRLIVRDDGVTMDSASASVSERRYLNTLNCNRTEYRFD